MLQKAYVLVLYISQIKKLIVVWFSCGLFDSTGW